VGTPRQVAGTTGESDLPQRVEVGSGLDVGGSRGFCGDTGSSEGIRLGLTLRGGRGRGRGSAPGLSGGSGGSGGGGSLATWHARLPSATAFNIDHKQHSLPPRSVRGVTATDRHSSPARAG